MNELTMSTDNFRTDILTNADCREGGRERFYQWVATRSLYAAILEGIENARLGMSHTIKSREIELNISLTEPINSPKDLPVELLFEFFKQYVMQQGWENVDSNKNLKSKEIDYGTGKEDTQSNYS